MNLFTHILKKFVPIPKILEYESFAFIGAHPDDIECGCGATVDKLVKLQKNVSFIIATDGKYGTMNSSISPEELIIIRKKESISSANILGVSDVRFLDFPDGGIYDINEAADAIAIELVDINPDIVFTIDNHVKSEIHPDHLQIGRASELALFKCTLPLIMQELGLFNTANPKGIAYYFTDSPNTVINVSNNFNQKISSIREHKSQFLSDNNGVAPIDNLIAYNKFTAIRYGLRRFCKYGEAFRILSNTHLHCMPEASKF